MVRTPSPLAPSAQSAQSAGSSKNQQKHRPTAIGSRMKNSVQLAGSSSAITVDTSLLPQCKVKRNYACSKCSYYTQNPRSFLHHQKNEHAEKLKVYECSHCLYASKHSQKLQRHIQMVHHANNKNITIRGYGNRGNNSGSKPPLVPPVRIRVQRVEKSAEQQQLEKLVIVEDVDIDEPEDGTEMENKVEEEVDEEMDRCSDDVSIEQDESMVVPTMPEDDDVDEDSTQQLDPSPPASLLRQQQQKNKYKQDKVHATFIRCSVCPFGSHSQTLVNRHEKSAHLKKKFFRCMKCNYVTHMRARYTKHVKYHTMPMIKCDDCDFRTPYKWNLDRHNRNHSSTAPGTYKCSHCSFSADIKQSLTVHETNHHVPPVGGVYPSPMVNRRKYRVGASDAPGSSVDGTEIVTYETTKEGGIVEITTETKSATPTSAAGTGGSSSATTNSTSTVVKKTIPSTVTSAPALSTMSTLRQSTELLNIVYPPADVTTTTSAKDEKAPAPTCRRPLPKLIPIVEQQQQMFQQQQQQQQKHQRRVPTIIRLRPPTVKIVNVDNADYYNVPAGQSALSDFASLIDDRDEDGGADSVTDGNNGGVNTAAASIATAATENRRPSSSSADSSSTSPKCKTTSFFDKLKARVDETADLTCQVCQYESKCLSEFMRHQRTHGDGAGGEDDVDACHQIVVINKPENATSSLPLPPPPPPTAAELKSTRCQRCRKRCKTSTELVLHLATCRGTVPATAAAAAAAAAATAVNNASHSAVAAAATAASEECEVNDNEDVQPQQQHPMENKIFVWNTALVPTKQDEVTDDNNADIVTVTQAEVKTEPLPDDKEPEQEDENEETYTSANLQLQQQKQQLYNSNIRKEGKMYKTVFKCPHCTFWAATASRFHVHIVGHLNRKPFECSCCAYRSNWRWDITKHIRLKSARKSGGDESGATSHHGAKVLMTDETGRRNYSKYNRYLTVMEMDIEDGADKAAGGEFEDGKGIASKKSVGGGATRKRRTVATSNNIKTQVRQLQTSKMATTGGVPPRKYKIAIHRSHQQISQQQQQENQLRSETKSPSPPLPPPVGGTDNRSKTVWKCKKCFFRDCDRLIVLNHVKAHYRRGDFGQSNNSGGTSKQNTSQNKDDNDTTTSKNKKNIEIKKSADPKKITEKNMIVTERRKTKATPTTGSASNLMLSTNPKSSMLYDDDNFLSCPLCDMTASSPGKLKEHMQRTHIPEETKYRCEYCPFWSEEKTAMLDHMMFAHEMDDGSVNTDVNSADVSNRSEQRNELNSTSNNEDEELRGIDETGSSNDTTHDMEVFDNGNGDDTTTTANMEVVFESSNESMVVVETIECKPNFVDNDCERMIESSMTPSKSSEQSSYSSINAEDNMINCEYDGGKELEDYEQVEADEDFVIAEEATNSGALNIKMTKAATNESSEVTQSTTEFTNKDQVYECNVCWYYSNNKRDMHAHKQLHVKRGALYNCTQCVFNVTKSAILYHHYRYGHIVEEPELRYPEDSVIRAGHKNMHIKNDRNDEIEEEFGCPPMVWSYCKESTPSFTKVYKCRYCPHTNRRRHNTIEHERMHSDHPGHQLHRQQQQRAAGSTAHPSPLHPCKRCTYVCNNAGVLASHVKVHSGSYGFSTIGFYDSTLVDVMQIRALEYVMNLEKNLLLDVDYYNNLESDTSSNQESAKYTELDDPELKFCSYCPARFFFLSDLHCHIQLHKFRKWGHACDCCSFTARALSQVTAHEVVHRDEYTERTAELLASGYPVSQQYPRPSEYPASVSDGSPRQPPSWSSPISTKCEVVEPYSTESDGRQQRRTKRPRDTDPNDVTTVPPLEQQDYPHKNTKRRRKSATSAIDNQITVPPTKTSVTVKTNVSAPTLNAQEAKIVNQKSSVKPIKTTKSYYVRQFMCDKCPGRFFKATALQYHKTLHGGTGQHKCRECDYAVSTYGNLVRHEYVHKDLPPRVKVKPITPKSLKSKAKLVKSSNSSETMPPPLTSNIINKDSNLSDGTNNEDFPVDPEFGPSMLGNPDFYYPTTVKNGVARPKRYKCAKCPSAFDKRDQYAVHLTLHGAQDKYQCDKCDYSVKYTANYVQHQRKHARDAEIRKNIEQAADRAKLIKDQEEASRAPRAHQKSKSGDQQLQPAEPLINLDPHDTEFRNEISDRQTAYELNTAYGATGIVGNILGDSDSALFRCSHCPYECSSRVQLNEHTTHHQPIKVVPITGSSAVPSKRPWKIACRFCTYRTHTESDLTDHTRVHFLRSTGATLSSYAASTTHLYDKNETIQPGDYVEFHGKRVIYNQQDKNGEENEGDVDNDKMSTAIADPDTVTTTADADTTVTTDPEDKNDNMTDNQDDPFFMFKDCSVGTPIGTTFNSKNKKYCPDYPIPPVLIDFNDNRTSSDATTKPQQQQTTAFVRFIKGGKRVEFLDNGSGGGDVVETGGKKKRGKK